MSSWSSRPRTRRSLLATAVLTLGVGVVASPGTLLAQSPPAGPVTVVDADGNPVEITDTSRVVTLGGVITEIAISLGAGDQVVGVDASSTFPPSALDGRIILPYYRTLAAEPVLAAAPTLIIGTDDVGPPEVVQQLRDAGVATLLLSQELTPEGAAALITTVGQALGRDAEAATLVGTLTGTLEDAAADVAALTASPSVMFLLLPPGAPLLVSGTGSAADTMITLAGATNAVSTFPGYVPLSPEVAVSAAPDVILTTTSSLEAAGGAEGLLALPGIAETPAGAAGAIVALDDLYLLGFGPRLGDAVKELTDLLHPAG